MKLVFFYFNFPEISREQLRNVLEVAGAVSLSYYFVYKPAKSILGWLSNKLHSGASKRILSPGPDDYAIITGATDGIGLEYARQLAERGYNLVLLSRTEEKLVKVASEIQTKNIQCKIEYLAVDFSRTDIYASIQAKLDAIDGTIHVLVNNVGTVNSLPNYFHTFAENFNLNLINTNIVSTTLMSEIVLKRMLQQVQLDTKRPKGVIINISSGLGRSPFPFYTTYSASKGYVNYLGKALAAEYSNEQILVQTVSPNLVKTKLIKDLYDDPNAPNPGVEPKDFVRYALASVGVEQETSAHPKHKWENRMTGVMESLLTEKWFMGLKYSIMKRRAVEKMITEKKQQ